VPMSEISERYARRAEQLSTTIAGVPADRWDAPSPCAEWTAREVVQHVLDSHALFETFVGRTLEQPSGGEDDLAARFDVARRQIERELADPATADEEFDGMMGRTSFAKAIDQFLSFDLLVHRWDLAKATGGDLAMDPADIARAFEQVRAMGPMIRSPQVFGPELDPPPGADEQTRLLAFLGRRA
jgi:uncharacterized protein (TIGR03086 family)